MDIVLQCNLSVNSHWKLTLSVNGSTDGRKPFQPRTSFSVPSDVVNRRFSWRYFAFNTITYTSMLFAQLDAGGFGSDRPGCLLRRASARLKPIVNNTAPASKTAQSSCFAGWVIFVARRSTGPVSGNNSLNIGYSWRQLEVSFGIASDTSWSLQAASTRHWAKSFGRVICLDEPFLFLSCLYWGVWHNWKRRDSRNCFPRFQYSSPAW